jgi:hypothetical protein
MRQNPAGRSSDAGNEEHTKNVRQTMNGGVPSRPTRKRIAQLLSTARETRRDLLREDPPGIGPPPHPTGDQLFAYWEDTLEEFDRSALEEHTRCCDQCLHWLLEVGKLFPGKNQESL